MIRRIIISLIMTEASFLIPFILDPKHVNTGTLPVPVQFLYLWLSSFCWVCLIDLIIRKIKNRKNEDNIH